MRFSIDPDEVYAKKSFDTVMNFAWLWKEQAEYSERFTNINRMMEESAANMQKK